MGMFDELEFDEGVELPENLPREGYQTKDFQNLLRTYRITEEGKLLEEKYHTEHVPEEERPEYDEDIEGFESSLHEIFGSINWVTDGWEEKDYHGIIEASALDDDYFYTLEIKFTDGELEDITLAEKRERNQ